MTDTATARSRRAGLSLETRMFLVTGLLIALSVGAAVAVTALIVQRIAREAALEELESSASVQASIRDRRQSQLEMSSTLFVSDPYLVAYLGEAAERQNIASILDALAQGQRDLGFDFAILLDPEGRVVARTDRPDAAGEELASRSLVARAVEGLQAASGVWQEGERLYDAVVVPVIKEFTVYGYLVAGFAITDAQAREVHEVSGVDVAFVAMDADGAPRVVGTSLPAAAVRGLTAALSPEMKNLGMEMGKPLPEGREGVPELRETELVLDGEPWFAHLTPLADGDRRPVGAAVVLTSLRRRLAAYRQIQAALLGAGLASAFLGGFLAFATARRTLGPVRRLVTAAEAARQGDYDQKIEADRSDEVGRLARAFNVLLADLREKRDMEAYVAELSRNLPEPAAGASPLPGQGAAAPAEARVRDVLLLGVELRGYAGAAGSAPKEVLRRLEADLRKVAEAVALEGGAVESVSGHRIVARFEGEGRGGRALAAAARALGADSGPGADPGAEPAGDALAESEAPAVVMASGRAVTGSVQRAGARPEAALVGLPVQQLESLLREATPGELLLSRGVHEELAVAFEEAGFRLAPRRGIVTPHPLYVVSRQAAARVAGARRSVPRPAAAASVATAGVSTLSGIAPGEILGQRFEILSELGAGGMGVVYKARDRELDDLVALKMLRREVAGEPGQIERLKSELKLARKITHPNVLRTYDFGEIGGLAYISMEYVRGVTLRTMLDQTSRLPYSVGLRIAKQLCAGLAAAHREGVIHRDIKPENLLLEPTGNAKLMDFGIARPVRRLTPGQTQEGWIVGTPQYLSPEQLQGQEPDTRADIYSCGIVFYEVFTGVLPFQASSAMEIAMKHLREEPPPPRSHWPEIPPRLDSIVLRCLAKDRDERYRSVDALLAELEALSA